VKINLLCDLSEPVTRGPGRRARNLLVGLERLGIPYELRSRNFDYAFGLQNGAVNEVYKELPEYTPIGPNVMHNAGDHTGVAAKFKNYVVQSDWVADYWRWQHPELTHEFNFHIYPPACDIKAGYGDVAKNRNPDIDCLWYTKYQNDENRNRARQLFDDRKHSHIRIEYNEYTDKDLISACARARYCIYNSCCEKGSNALMEILACGVPVYVVDSVRWIGDDRFDRCTSAPHFDDRCGVIGGIEGQRFSEFIDGVNSNKYDPHGFVAEGFTVEHTAKKVWDILQECHP